MTLRLMMRSMKGLFATLSILCRYAECDVLFVVMLSAVMVSVVVPLWCNKLECLFLADATNIVQSLEVETCVARKDLNRIKMFQCQTL
jgi:hypothetical protein